MALLLERDPSDWSGELARLEEERPDLAPELRARFALLLGTGPAASDAGGAPGLELAGFTGLVEVGRGGMGIVFRAREQSLGRDVALKVIRPERLYFDGARARFRREVEATARLSHPGIVKIHSVGGLEPGGVPHFAMELLAGATLAARLARLSGRAPETIHGADVVPGADRLAGLEGPRAVADLGAQLARALAHAHERGVLHRDVKPANVVVEPDGRAVLLDFGLTSFSPEGDAHSTATGSTLGTLVYTPPEHLEGRRTGPEGDVYGLGATLYEALALQPPFAEPNTGMLRAAIVSGAAPPLRARNRAVSRDLAAVVQKAMEVRPADRYATAAEFADDLERAARGEPVHASPPGPARRAARWVRRRPVHAAALLLALAVAMGGPVAYAIVAARHGREMGRVAESERAAREDAEAALRDLESALAFVDRMFAAASPDVHGGDVPDAVEMVERGASVLDAAALTERAEARIRLLLGRLYSVLVRPEEAGRHLSAAVPLLRERATGEDASPEDVRRFAEALRMLAHDRALAGRPAEAAPLLDEAEARLVERLGPDAADLHAIHATRADVLEGARDFEGALRARERSLGALVAAGAGDEAVRLGEGLRGLALADLGRDDEARSALADALSGGPFEDPTRRSQFDRLSLELAEIEARQGDLAPALERVDATLARLETRLGEDNLLSLQARLQRGRVRAALGPADESLEDLQRATEGLRGALDAGHPLLATADRDLVQALASLGRSEAVVAHVRETGLLERAGPGLGRGSWSHTALLRTIALSAQATGHDPMAEAALARLEAAERSAGALAAGHAESILLLVAHRAKTGAPHAPSGGPASAKLLRELIDAAGDAGLPVRSSTNGQTFEAGYMARLFLAGVLEPSEPGEARRLRAEAAERRRSLGG